jgi:hypothetical protein
MERPRAMMVSGQNVARIHPALRRPMVSSRKSTPRAMIRYPGTDPHHLKPAIITPRYPVFPL